MKSAEEFWKSKYKGQVFVPNMPIITKTDSIWNYMTEYALYASQFQPSELSDEEIETWADSQERRLSSYHMGLQAGARWYRDQLKKKER